MGLISKTVTKPAHREKMVNWTIIKLGLRISPYQETKSRLDMVAHALILALRRQRQVDLCE